MDARNAGLIWVSGFTSSGKTTIARKVRDILDRRGIPSILLDGDNLRSIFGDKFGYQPDQRRELAKSYMRLSSNLSSQGYVVILAAIALYDDAAVWMQKFIPRSLQVFLDVPDEVRATRDRRIQKNIYDSAQQYKDIYDEPLPTALRINNSDGVDPYIVAEQIVSAYYTKKNVSIDLGRKEHWNSFYKSAELPVGPSPFACAVAQTIQPGGLLVEIGCGNGRDSFYFAGQGCRVVAVDPSSAAIQDCLRRQAPGSNGELTFFCGDAGEAHGVVGNMADHVYSRFTLHAMPLEEEIKTLRHCASMLKPSGRLHVECRSINDPLARQGDVVSGTERVKGHYRRFIVKDELLLRVQAVGLTVTSCEESGGWAKTS
ncbi:MAG: adenylyl-sulfate kinase, partial [Brevundimonas sp.]|nr:adenylyl-sulfate kinase [Brevundimonas sp.]